MFLKRFFNLFNPKISAEKVVLLDENIVFPKCNKGHELKLYEVDKKSWKRINRGLQGIIVPKDFFVKYGYPLLNKSDRLVFICDKCIGYELVED